MTDLAVTNGTAGDLVAAMRTETARRAGELLSRVTSLDDLERLFLYGGAISPKTRANYKEAVGQFLKFSGGLVPVQVTAGDIESFFDDQVRKVKRGTAKLRIAGLRFFFERVAAELPGFSSPFEGMSPKLEKKLRKPPAKPQKTALTPKETERLLAYLAADQSARGSTYRATMILLLGSGLRAFEAVGLRWKDLEQDDETSVWYAVGIGKGDKPFRQELALPGTVEALRKAFRAIHGRSPKRDESVLWTCGRHPVPLRYRPLWERVKAIGAAAEAAGIVTRSITWSPHLTRHTALTLAAKAGMPVDALRRFARHSNLATTSVYLHNDAPAGPFLAKALGRGEPQLAVVVA